MEAELLGHHSQSFSVETLVDRDWHTEAHAGADDLHHRHVHHRRQLVGGDELGHLQHLLVLFLTHHLLHHAARHLLTLLAAVLGGLRLTHRSETCQGVLDLLRDLLFCQLRFLFALAFLVLLAELRVVFQTFLATLFAGTLTLAGLASFGLLATDIHAGACRIF